MTAQTIAVFLDDRPRLISAVLAATSWPQEEQARKRHRAHAHARGTVQHVQDAHQHPAVRTLQTLLDQGAPLATIYSFGFSLSWPELIPTAPIPGVPAAWAGQLRDFLQHTGLVEWWEAEEESWQRAAAELSRVLEGIDVGSFLARFVGPVSDELLAMPNISYPSDTPIGVRLAGHLACLIPPRIAWGENPPWPFDEDLAYILQSALSHYARLLVVAYLRQHAPQIAPFTSLSLPITEEFRRAYTTWGEQLAALFTAGAVALFLEEVIGPAEAQAYVLIENRVNGLQILPQVVSVLHDYRRAYARGEVAELGDYLVELCTALQEATQS